VSESEHDPPTPLGPTRLVVTLANPSAAELLAVLHVFDQLVAQIWELHGDAVVDFILRHPDEHGVSGYLPF